MWKVASNSSFISISLASMKTSRGANFYSILIRGDVVHFVGASDLPRSLAQVDLSLPPLSARKKLGHIPGLRLTEHSWTSPVYTDRVLELEYFPPWTTVVRVRTVALSGGGTSHSRLPLIVRHLHSLADSVAASVCKLEHIQMKLLYVSYVQDGLRWHVFLSCTLPIQ